MPDFPENAAILARARPSILFTSTSPRQKALLEQLGFREGADFLMVQAAVGPADDGEGVSSLTLETARANAVNAAREKIRRAVNTIRALTVHSLNPEHTVVVGADTVAFCGDRPMDRPPFSVPEFAGPIDMEEARSIAKQRLEDQSGNTISIITGLVVAQADRLSNERSSCVLTRAFRKKLAERDIERYVATREPLDLAGAFGIQERGVVLFEKIEGSYSNIAGLPLAELHGLLHDELFAGRIRFPSGPTDTSRQKTSDTLIPELSVVSAGDIDFDPGREGLEAGLFTTLPPPGVNSRGKGRHSAGGTAVTFAVAARNAGFKHCSVIGVAEGGAAGEKTGHELHQKGIDTLTPRGRNAPDTSLTPGDARQALQHFIVERARPVIAAADVFYLSGNSLIDANRRATACEMLRIARKSGRITVLDAVVGMSRFITLEGLCSLTRDGPSGKPLIDVFASEVPDVLSWLGLADAPQDWEGLAAFLEERAVAPLRRHFAVLFLRPPEYSHELIATPSGVTAEALDCSRLPAGRQQDYGDRLTAEHLREYMSPRILLASRSPQRLALLRQLVAANKIEVRAAEHPEDLLPNETPRERVVRLAREKARVVFEKRAFTDDIEILIAADTEVVVPADNGRMEIAAHPRSREEAVAVLRQLSGKEHLVLTGMAVVGADPHAAGKRPRLVSECVATSVKFRRLSETEISDYADSGECFGRAGAYAIQGQGAVLVERVDGSYSNVVGLPVERLAEILDLEFGLPVWDMNAISDWKRPRRLKEIQASALFA